MAHSWAIGIAGLIISAVGIIATVVLGKRSRRDASADKAESTAYQNWRDAHRGAHRRARALLDRLDAHLTVVCRTGDVNLPQLQEMLADLLVIVGKASQWHAEPTNLLKLQNELIELEQTLSGPMRFGRDRIRYHRQGVAAAQARALIPAVRDEIDGQWGPDAWRGLAPAV